MPKPGEVCVDLGSGRGTDILRMADEVGETGFVYGIDISEGMIEKARQNASKFEIKNVRFLRCELDKIDITMQLSFFYETSSNRTPTNPRQIGAGWGRLG